MNTFTTKIDTWLMVVLVIPMLLVIGLGIYLFPNFPDEALLCWGTLLFSVGIVAAVGYPCTYTLEADQLLIRSGIVRYRIPYTTITQVDKSSSIWSGPAWSLQRIKICYGDRRFILISPQNRETFITALQSRIH